MIRDVESVRRLLTGVVCLTVLALAPLQAAPAARDVPLKDDWQALYLMGQKVGYQHQVVRRVDADGGRAFQTSLRQQFTIARGEAKMSFQVETEVTEDADGRLLSFKQTMVQGPLVKVTAGKVAGKVMALTEGFVPMLRTRRVPAPEGLCPWALERLRRRKGFAEGTQYSVSAFVPDMPERDVHMKVTVGPRERIRLYEVVRWLRRSDTEIDVLPGVRSSEWTDEAGTVWLARVALSPQIVLESRKTTRAMALAPNEPADILSASFVQADAQIPDPRRLERLEIVIEPLPGAAPDLTLPSGPWQQVRRQGDGLHVTVRRAHGDPAKSYRLPCRDPKMAALLEPNVWLETQDARIVRMARQALGGESDALRAAARIERYVREAVRSKNLSIGMATAAETAEQKAGDCTEHSVLAAALARAVGMPSRVVAGLVYAPDLLGPGEGAFGYHMWTELYVGEWLPIDATLGGHDATHLALARSDLNGPTDLLELSSAISRLLGKVRVHLVGTGG